MIGGLEGACSAPTGTKTYAASNTIYVARQNNVLFSVLAQFFGPEAINDRLMLIETVSFTTTPEDMLESLTRIIADRSVGALFFGNYHLMDYELMGGDARDAIIAERRQARHEAVPAARRAVRLASMADADHAGTGPTRSPTSQLLAAAAVGRHQRKAIARQLLESRLETA